MNNKGFTLIELLGVIVLLSIIMSVTAISVIGVLKGSKEKSYDILVTNIKIASQQYIEECESNEILGNSISTMCSAIREKGNNCQTDKCATISLDSLVKYGFLKSSVTDENGNKIIENPKTNTNIGTCLVEIKKSVDKNNDYAIEYNFSTNSTNTNCPKFSN